MKILYVAGAGRSGSTLMDMALGQAHGVLSCGELLNLSGVVHDKLLCSCGTPVGDCSFWGKVVLDVGTYEISEELRLNHSRRLLSWIKVFLGSRQRRYIEWVDSVYEAIGRLSDASVIIDSSKSPLRLAALLRYSRHEIYVLHLVRDPKMVALSLAKPLKQDVQAGVQHDLKGKQYLRSYGFWTAVNFLVHFAVTVNGARRRYVRINYEAFIREPSMRVQEALSMCGSELKDVRLENEFLKSEHVMAGNRLRLMKNVVIRDDVAALPSKHPSALGRIISWPLRRSYGYS
jgi:hypothetical protein